MERAGADDVGHAVVDLLVEQQERDALQARLGRAHLDQHVDAIAVLLHHPLEPRTCASMRRNRASTASLSLE